MPQETQEITNQTAAAETPSVQTKLPHLARLSLKQKEIATYKDSHTRVIACPGSGKTSTLLSHLAELINIHGVNHSRILVLAFNKSVAQKLQEDILSKHFLDKEHLPVIATLHGYALKLLYKYHLSNYIGKASFPYEDVGSLNDEKVHIIEPILYQFMKKNGYRVHRLAFDKSLWKPYALHHWFGKSQRITNELKIFDQGLNWLKGVFGMRFLSELPADLYKLLNTRPDVIEENHFDHIIIDEFQDLNVIDRKLIQVLARLGSRVCVVGDDDQSVYGFRGADPDGLLNFHVEFENTKSFTLEDCFRCPRNIIEYGKHIIDQHPGDRKNINSLSSTQGMVKQLQFRSEKNELDCVVSIVKNYIEKMPEEIRYGDKRLSKSILVLVGSNRFLSQFRKAFNDAGISTQSEETLLDSQSVHLTWLLLRYFANNDQVALYGILQFKFPKEWQKVFEKIFELQKYNELMETTLDEVFSNSQNLKPQVVDRVKLFYSELVKIKQKINEKPDIIQQLEFIFQESKRILPDIGDEKSNSFIESLKEQAQKFDPPINNLEDFGWVINDLIFENAVPSDNSTVTLISLRKAKGLEADAVIMCGIEDNVMPGNKDQNEAIRLLYVGATRAQRALFVSFTNMRVHNRHASGQSSFYKQASRFLPMTPTFEKGDVVCKEIIENPNFWTNIA